MLELLAGHDGIARWVFELGFVAYVLSISFVVILERRRPAATLAWLMSLVFLPVLGLLLYMLFGRRRVRRHRRHRALRRNSPTERTHNIASLAHSPDDLEQPLRGLVRLALRTSAAPLRRATDVELLHDGERAFSEMERAIAGAKHHVHAQFYIWRGDATGVRMLDKLIERARAGIKVRLLYDDWGSFGTSREHFAPLIAAGGQVIAFGRLRLRLRLRRSRVNFRNHRKILAVDGRVGFTGGLNVGDEYSGRGQPRSAWRDLHVRLEGAAVLGLDAIFLEDWAAAGGERVPDPVALPLDLQSEAANELPPDRAPHSPLVQIIPSGPDFPVASAIAMQIAAAIANANTRCYIATPYFVPTEALDQNLKLAAMRGTDVRILVPAPRMNDHRIVALAARSYYDEFLYAGCRIFEYQPGMLHAKYLVVDDCVAGIGSANMDVRSFHINYEVTAMFYDQGVTRQLAEVFVGDLADSKEVVTADRQQLSTPMRLAEASARLFSPLL